MKSQKLKLVHFITNPVVGDVSGLGQALSLGHSLWFVRDTNKIIMAVLPNSGLQGSAEDQDWETLNYGNGGK